MLQTSCILKKRPGWQGFGCPGFGCDYIFHPYTHVLPSSSKSRRPQGFQQIRKLALGFSASQIPLHKVRTSMEKQTHGPQFLKQSRKCILELSWTQLQLSCGSCGGSMRMSGYAWLHSNILCNKLLVASTFVVILHHGKRASHHSFRFPSSYKVPQYPTTYNYLLILPRSFDMNRGAILQPRGFCLCTQLVV